MHLRIEKSPSLCTLQDAGRQGWRCFGVPVSGAADWVSFRLANAVLGNAPDAPALEVAGGLLQAIAESGGWLALSGAGGSLWLDGQPAPSGARIIVPAGTLVQVRPAGEGVFSYLSVSGGWQATPLLGSRSTCLAGGFGGFEGRCLRAGDTIKSEETQHAIPVSGIWISPVRLNEGAFFPKNKRSTVRVMPGPEPEMFKAFLQTTWRVSKESNRMGIRLEGAVLFQKTNAVMPSAAAMPGTVQLPPDGCPIVLSTDAQTTGGYPRVAQVIAADLPVLVQKPPGCELHFEQCDPATAGELFLQMRAALGRVAKAHDVYFTRQFF